MLINIFSSTDENTSDAALDAPRRVVEGRRTILKLEVRPSVRLAPLVLPQIIISANVLIIRSPRARARSFILPTRVCRDIFTRYRPRRIVRKIFLPLEAGSVFPVRFTRDEARPKSSSLIRNRDLFSDGRLVMTELLMLPRNPKPLACRETSVGEIRIMWHATEGKGRESTLGVSQRHALAGDQ